MDTLLNSTDQTVIKQQTAINNRYLTATTSGLLCYFLLFLVAHTDPTNIILLFFLWLEIFTLFALAVACTTQVFYGLADMKTLEYTASDRFVTFHLEMQKLQRGSILSLGSFATLSTLPTKPFNQEALALPAFIFRVFLFAGFCVFLSIRLRNKNSFQLLNDPSYKSRFSNITKSENLMFVFLLFVVGAGMVVILLLRMQVDFYKTSSIFDSTLLIILIFVAAMIILWQLWQLKPKQQTVKQ